MTSPSRCAAGPLRAAARHALAVALAMGPVSAFAAHTGDVEYKGGYQPSEGFETDYGFVQLRSGARAEMGIIANRDAREDLRSYAGMNGRIVWEPVWFEDVEIQAGLRVDVYQQAGGRAYSEAELDYDEISGRARFGDAVVTLGSQHVVWGRIDELPPTDRLSVQDTSRYLLDKLDDRRRATPAVRVEYTRDALKVDAIVVPFFRAAELPERDSIWFPVDQRRGKILGIGSSNPLYTAAVQNGSVGNYEDFEQFGGAGVRIGHSAEEFDYSVTVQRARRSLPYYQLDPAVRAAGLAGQPLAAALAAGNGPTFREVHPLSWVLGVDTAFDAVILDTDLTFRVEATYLNHVPITTTDARLSHTSVIDWAGGFEFYPGDADTRVSLYLAHRELLTNRAILDEDRIISLFGEVEHPFDNDRWRWTTRFSAGLEYADTFINTELRYVGDEPHEFFVGAYMFAGSKSSTNGYYSDYDQITLGWRARF